MICVNLTRKQVKQLRKHFDVANACYRMGVGSDEDHRGVLVAQVHEDWEGLTGIIRVNFFPASQVKPILEAVRKAHIPNGYAGIPAPSI